MLLFRPVGLRELELIAKSGFTASPPRLAHQPIFYPVLNFEYAKKIARDWNTKDPASGYSGFVTKFEIADSYVEQFEVHTVGASSHQELWVPAEHLDEFNASLGAPISVVSSYYGDQFSREIDVESNLPTHVVSTHQLRSERSARPLGPGS